MLIVSFQVLARSIDRLPTEDEASDEDEINVDLSDSDMEDTATRSKPFKSNGQDDGKSFKPNLGAFADGSDDGEEDDFSELDSEDDGSDVEEFSGFAGADDASDDDEEDAEMISEPSLPSDAEFDSDEDDTHPVNLRDFVDSLPGGKKRKVAFEDGEAVAEGVADEAAGKKKRRVLPSMQGPGGREEGGDFGLNPSECASFLPETSLTTFPQLPNSHSRPSWPPIHPSSPPQPRFSKPTWRRKTPSPARLPS